MSDSQLCQETPILLTRKEVRKILRVNETTIDCWLRERKLEQLPCQEDSGVESMIALRESALRDRFNSYVEDRGDVDLAIDALPAMARFQLLKMMLRPDRAVSRTMLRRGARMRPLRIGRRRRMIRRSRRSQPTLAKWESSPSRMRTAKAKTAAVGKGRRLGRNRRSLLTRTSLRKTGKRQQDLGTELCEQTVDVLFPAKQTRHRRRKPVVEPNEDLSALQEIAEASDQAEMAEALWGDDLLSLVQDVVESVAEEVEQQLEGEVWLALDGADDPGILAETETTEEVLVVETEGDQEGDPEIAEVEIMEDPDDAVAAEPPVEDAAGEIIEDDDFQELDLGPEDWLPGEEMVEALSHSPVFAAADSSQEDLSQSEVGSFSPTELEIDELFQPLDASQEYSSEISDFVSEEASALFRIEEQLAQIEDSTAQHRETEFAELAEIRADIAATWSQEEAILESVGKLEKDVTVLKRDVKSTNKSARSSLKVSRRTQTQMKRRLKNLGVLRVGGNATAVMPIAAGVLITSWAMTIYLKTGDLRMALGGLVLVNLLACASLLHSKTGRFF